MPQAAADVALLTDRRYTAESATADDWYLGNIIQDDQLLRAALARQGLSTSRIDWSRQDVDWSKYQCLLFRTTWDYFDRFDEFTSWLARVETQVSLCNAAETVRWNVDKHYLADLESRSVPVVASRFVERGSAATLATLLDETGWSEAVIKPCVSGAARHTYRVSRDTASALEPVVKSLLASESLILQPFQRSITTEGEDSLLVFGGRYTHAVRKVAKAGDFRVQDDHGGTVRAYQPTRQQIELAESATAACSPVPAYARADIIRDNDGRLAIMELELIEPELWIRYHPASADVFATAVVEHISRNS